MKVSELVKHISRSAELVFGTTDHINDGISVGMYFNGEEWQVWLERPTDSQLDRGEVVLEKLHTIKRFDSKIAFFTTSDSLMSALYSLQDEIDMAEEWPE